MPPKQKKLQRKKSVRGAKSGPPGGPSIGGPRSRVILVMGPPGAGKGTQCKYLVHKFGFLHVSTGDIFRDAVAKKTELGLQAEPYIKVGGFIPDALVVSMVKARLEEADALAKGVLLDGFPRTLRQARELVASIDVERLILLQASDEVCTVRMLGRRVDPETGESFHLTFMPPSKELADKLIRRDYDMDEKSVRLRLQVWHAQLGAILPLFAGKIVAVNGARKPDEVQAAMESAVNAPLEPVPDEEPESPASPAAAAAAAPPALPAKKEVHKCCVCTDALADHLVVPCGHQCGCKPCLGELAVCPICRKKIDGLVKVFQAGFLEEESDGGVAEELKVEAKGLEAKDLKQMHEAGGVADDGGWGDEEEEKKEEGKSEVKVVVTPCDDVQSGSSANIAVSIHVPNVMTREPVDICCVVDISGSMGGAAKFQDESGVGTRDDGMTILDLVKHAVKTVMHTLGPEDRLAVVAFDEKADIVFALGEMTEGIRKQAETALAALQPRGNTNIWEGVLRGLETLRAPPPAGAGHKSRKKCLFLLTDGRPNISPPKGHVPALKEYNEKHAEFNYQINTFGFGYNLDSQLLWDLAHEARGTYAFIPDAKILGTCFVDAVSNAVSQMTQSAQLHLLLQNEAKFAGPVKGSLPVTDTRWGRVVELGPLQFGQNRDIVVPIQIPAAAPAVGPAYLEAVLVFSRDGEELRFTGDGARVGPSPDPAAIPDAISALMRCEVVDTLYTLISEAMAKRGKTATQVLATLVGKIAGFEVSTHDPRLTALKAEVEGRVSKAFTTKERFDRWGKHYLRALTRSHQIQQCTNFMDPGLQVYGGALFKTLRETGGKIFITLPPPTPSRAHHHAPAGYAAASLAGPAAAAASASPAYAPMQAPAPAPAAPAMDQYYQGGGGGCLGGDTLVRVRGRGRGRDRLGLVRSYDDNDNSEEVEAEMDEWKRVCDLRAGDRVRVLEGGGGGGGFATVQCVVRLKRDPSRLMLQFPSSSLTITPGHPIFLHNQWVLPRSLPSSTPSAATPTSVSWVECVDGIVYSIVLDRSHILMTGEGENTIGCICWGHGMKEGILNHSFFGTDRVIESLQRQPGWKHGLIDSLSFIRKNNEVVGFMQN